MKIFHKKLLNQEVYEDDDKELSKQGKSGGVYLLHQILIWGSIFLVIYFIVKFYPSNR